MGFFSPRYVNAAVKKMDGIPEGSSTLWAQRAVKAYGVLPFLNEHKLEAKNKADYRSFDYSSTQMAIARRFRNSHYERLLSPREIIKALRYRPISVDIQIFNSIFSDLSGVVTLPDEEDKKCEFDHTINILSYDSESDSFVFDSNNWSNWGRNGLGTVSMIYLERYFITAFVSSPVFIQGVIVTESRRKIKLRNRKWYIATHPFYSCREDERLLYNLEVYDAGGNLAGWLHYAMNSQNAAELLDLYVLEEYRRQGVGSFLIQEMRQHSKAKEITGFVSAHDLINEREERVKCFLLKNGLLPMVNKSQFKDARFRLEKL
ncbi:N-acetyltransferase [Candidatus Parcubacteria bacterium]|nr:MAG: N-acetyltransferase [Candidatus Parcubacteria bacterium]